MRTNNSVMMREGFAPAAVVARTLDKSLSTIHRLVTGGKVKGTRDGKALYIELASLADWYVKERNPTLARAVRALRDKLVKEHAA